MNAPQIKFQQLLRELFQFDCADLDFGIYRIMNLKRAVIERFIAEDLRRWVNDELNKGALAGQSQAAQDLQAARQKVLEALGEDALDAEGNLAEKYRETKAGKEYLEAQTKAQGARSTEALETDIYNHLYAFFSRYWQDGDFISKRRYSKKERYATPYNGEEVTLYWANHDQYYVKTGEYFTDYTWKAPNGVTVHFKLQAADVEQNNVKGEKRFFLPRLGDTAWDAQARTLTVPFEFRPLTPQEQIAYGQKNQQEAIIAEALEKIPKRLPKGAPDALAALTAEKRRADGTAVTLLEHHLRQYTRRNTSDFFIHKDLKGFLSRELDFYLKNEVLNLEELEAAGEDLAEGWFQLMRLIKRIGLHIIEFLAQIEGFQKMLWENKKFVTETFYVVTVGNLPEAFYPEIAANEAQWRELLAIDALPQNLLSGDWRTPEGRIAFLKANPSLPLDTRHFPPDFTDRLLASFDNLDDLTDGLLIHSENFQALSLLQARYQKCVKTVAIDPPYNRQGDGFPYKDNYKHSSWLSMMNDRLGLAWPLLTQEGALFSNIDENERDSLQAVLDGIFGRDNRIAELIWAQNTTHSQSPLYSTNHEYIEVYVRDRVAAEQAPAMFREPKPGYREMMALLGELNPHYPPVAEVERAIQDLFDRHIDEYKAELLEQGLDYDEEARKQDPWRGIYNYCHAEYRDAEGRLVPGAQAKTKAASVVVWQEADASAPAQKQSPSTRDPNDPNFRFYRPTHPKTGKPCPPPKTGWRWPYSWPDNSRDSFEALDRAGRIVWGENERKVPRYKRFLHEVETNVAKSFFHDYTDGEKQIAALFGTAGLFPTPKPTTLPTRFISQTCGSEGLILDHFAGSGTTGHAVINLNREDGGRRKFILVEMAHYFDTVLLPRIKKVTFTPEWKDGKPKRAATQEEFERGPRIVKVIRLESYEDALNNLSFDEGSAQRMLQFEDYLLRYMLRWESRKSETLLNVEKLSKPFDYCLHIHRDGETRVQRVDLPETFAYLIGLDVEKRQLLDDQGRRYLVYRGLQAWRDRYGRSTLQEG